MSNILTIVTILIIGAFVGVAVIVGMAAAIAALDEQERTW